MDTDVDILKAFSAQWGFKFYLTRNQEDFQNLLDDPFKGFYLIAAQGTINPNFKSQFTIDHEFNGKVFVCKPSQIDGVLIAEDGTEDKYTNVKKAVQIKPWFLLNLFDCPSDVIIKTKNAKPFYNLWNTNYDGIVFDYTITFKNVLNKLTEAETKAIIQNG